MKIVLATDGSAGSTVAARFLAANVSPAAGQSVDVVTVHEWLAGDVGWSIAGAFGTTMPPATSPLYAASEMLRSHGFSTTATILTGRPNEAIPAFARWAEAGLIVLGSRGLHGWRRALAGSISSSVARSATMPVLVVGTAGQVRRVVIGYDGSAPARSALEAAARLPMAVAPEFVVCVAYEATAPFASGIAPTMVAAIEEAYAADLAEAHRAADITLQEGREILAGHGFNAIPVARHGPPTDVLVTVAGQPDESLIAVGDRGRSPLERLVLGSTSAALLGAGHLNVLVAHAPPGATAAGH